MQHDASAWLATREELPLLNGRILFGRRCEKWLTRSYSLAAELGIPDKS